LKQWAEKTGMVFAPEKSELLYFSRARDECTLSLQLGASIIRPTTKARFLGVWLNNKLSCKAHIAKVKSKMKIQMLALSKLAASAWGTSVPRARQVYAVVIRSVLAYEAPSWHGIGEGLKSLSRALTPTQNKCLRIVAGAYKATPTRYFESEMAMPPLDLYFDKWVADFEDRIELSGMAQLLRNAGAKAAEAEMAAGSRRGRQRREAAQRLTRDSRAQAAKEWKDGKKNIDEVMLEKWRDKWKEAVAANE
jgi:hypothetical protein